ncbi:hypothetical protein BWI97_10540 [Siphonobacter sp. BAB-5405]|nr:hypothetical protein BWI97_10540 [Siphonobacter sp. BAB-5405]
MREEIGIDSLLVLKLKGKDLYAYFQRSQALKQVEFFQEGLELFSGIKMSAPKPLLFLSTLLLETLQLLKNFTN